jgi:Predicted transcription factor, homolog of eukaryotic MBF1
VNNNGLPRVLKFLRAMSGLTQERVAERLNVSTSLIAKFETGRLVPMPDTAAQIDKLYGSGDLVQELSADARRSGPPEWFRQWPDLEREATSLRYHQPTYVPGLLQTEAYARAVLTTGLLTPDEVEANLAIRLERQVAVFTREKPPVCTFIIDELALLRGDPAVMKEQLLHIAEMAERPRIFIHVVPRSAGLYAGQMGYFVLASLPGGGDAAYLEDPVGGRVISDPEKLDEFSCLWDAVHSVALPRDMSQDLIRRMASEL